MNVLIDTSPLQNQNAGRGVGRYTSELLAALLRLKTSHHFFASTESPSSSIDLIHYPFFDLFFHTLPLFQRRKTIVTIHDVTPLIFAKHYPPGIKGRLRHALQKISLASVSHVITDSAISKRDIVEKLHVNGEKVSVVPLAASVDFEKQPQAIIDAARKKYEIPKYYVLYVGDINYNKNIPFLISAMRHVPRITLVLVGRNMTNTSIPEGRAIKKAIEKSRIQKRIKLVTTVDTSSMSDLSALYSGSMMYIQPSLYEGFGLPVLEAMQCRTPVVSSIGGSLPEVCGDAAMYFHPHDEEECANAIQKVLRLSDRQRQQLILKGVDQASKFTWERTARETLAVYEKVMSK